MTWLVPFPSLTADQQQAVLADTRQHQAIVGGPGAGKTLILVHRLALLYERACRNPSAVRLLVYTNTLKEFIRSALDLLGIPEECVCTFDSWCKEVYTRHVSSRLPYAERRVDFAAIRQGVLDAWKRGLLPAPLLDIVLVDETQDLEPEVIRWLAGVARHVTVCMDGKQQIFDRGASEPAILGALGLSRQNAALLAAYRCNPMVTRLAARFIADTGRREEFLRQAANPVMDRTRPLFHLAENHHEEMGQLIDLLRLRLTEGNSIAVLFPQQRQVHGYATGLEEKGIKVEVHRPRQPFDFANRLPKLMTYHQAKGLTFDSVFLPRLVNGSFPGALGQQLDSLLFVGVSRAIQWVYLSGVNGSLVPPCQQLWQEDTNGYLEKQFKPKGLFEESQSQPTAEVTQEHDDFGLD